VRLAWEIGGGAVAALVVGILVYALGSFAMMALASERRAFGMTLREIAREVWLAIVTQPFLLLYYVLGRRMDPVLLRGSRQRRPDAVPVVFVHGYMQNRVGFVGLARALARQGFGPLYGINYPWFLSITANAQRLERFVAKVCAETKAPMVDLVCHSMGGLVAMEMLHGEASSSTLKVRKCVTIATPHAGVSWRGPMIGFGASMLRKGSKLLTAQAGYKVAIPTLSLYSTHDNIVFPMTTSQLATRGGKDVAIEGLGHLSILFSPVVAENVASFLAEPAAPAVIVPPDGARSQVLDLPAHEPGGR